MGAFGEAVLIRHAYGFMTRYAHLLEIKVRRGDKIKQGQLVGLMGNTGRSVGTHLHYEVLIDEVPYDPFNFFAPRALPAVPAEN
jgi:murein DD-endopeptidase MepM/ murein hydrolase activator NlpD